MGTMGNRRVESDAKKRMIPVEEIARSLRQLARILYLRVWHAREITHAML